MINNPIGIHPKGLLNYSTIDTESKSVTDAKVKGYDFPKEFYASKITEGVATPAAGAYPEHITVRLSDLRATV